MSILDQLGGILSQYASGSQPPSGQATDHFQQVATQVPQSTLGNILTSVFQSPETGSFGENVSQMYGQSNPHQQAGFLNHIMESLGPGILSRFLPGIGGGQNTTITPEQAQSVSPENVRVMADEAQRQDPGIVEKASEFYSRHPQLVQALGAGAAIWAMQRFENH